MLSSRLTATELEGTDMHADLRDFLARFIGTVAMTLVPVVLTAFLSIPISLGRHPGDPPRDADAPAAAHMT